MQKKRQKKNFIKIWQLCCSIIYQSSRVIIGAVIRVIQLYQKTISPDHGILHDVYHARHCRFFPSCSDYAIQTLRQYGLMRGIVLSLRRIVCCNPFCTGGYDPVLPKSTLN